jgi:Ca2+-binding RTX toxin-like protein
MAAIDFGNFPADFTGVNMANPDALGAAILSNFASFNFTGGFRDPTLVQILRGGGGSADILVDGNFMFEGNGAPTDGSSVFAIEVRNNDLGYRFIATGLNMSWQTLRLALLDGNLSPLWAGEALLIHGHATLGDTLVGGSLGDEIYGYGGQDVLIGNAGSDYLDGMGGKDTMRGGLGNDDYFVSHERDLIVENGGEGIDAVITTLDGYRLPTNFEDLGLFVTAGAIDAVGNAADNFMAGNNYANRMQGLVGDDTLAGAGGRDVLSGGDGNDELDGQAGADQLRGGAGNDFLYWDALDLQVDGGAGLDTLIVKSGNLDVTAVPAGRIADIERFSMVGSSIQTLTLAKSDVLELSTSTDTIRVLGGSSDRVNIVGSFIDIGTSDGFTTYKLGGGAKLIVEADIEVV